MAAINATYRQSVNRNKSLRSWNWMRQDSCLLQSAKLSLAINRMCCSPHRKESHPSDRWWDFRPINGTPVTDWVPERLATWRHLKIIDQRRVKWKGFRCSVCIRTDYSDMQEEALMGRCADLTLVDATVPLLSRVDFQYPVLVSVHAIRMNGLVAVVRFVNGPESLVGRVRVSGHCQQMDVSMAHPWHLSKDNKHFQ